MPALDVQANGVIHQGRRAGQPKSARGLAMHNDLAQERHESATSRERPISSRSPTNRGQGRAEHGFGRMRSMPDSSERGDSRPSGEAKPERRIRVVHQEKGPYRTIQAALDEALEGEIISVSPGFYREQLTVQHNNVRIVGKLRDAQEVVLECSADKHTLRIDRDAGEYRLENLVFRPCADEAPEESSAAAGARLGRKALASRVKNNIADLAKAEKDMLRHDTMQGGYACVVAQGRVTFLNCTFSGSACGGVLISGDNAESLIFSCRFSASPAGTPAVQVEERARARVRKCMFDKCLGMGVQAVKSECTLDDNSFSEMFNYAVQFTANAAGCIRRNSFVCGRKASIAVSGNAAPAIEGNTISKSLATGIFIFDCGRPTVQGNDLKGCMLAAIEVRDEGSDPMILNNSISDGSDGGIVVHNLARGTVRGNTISGNAKAGITACTGAAAIIAENLILSGRGAGILCHSEAGGVLRANRIRQTDKAGIEVRKKANPQVVGNVIADGNAQGILVHAEGCGYFEGNEVARCRGALAEVRGTSGKVVLKDNEFVGRVGGSFGLLVLDCACPEVVGNSFKDLAKAAVHIAEGGNPVVYGNHISASEEQGILVVGDAVSDACLIRDNEIVGCQAAGIDVSNGAAPVVTRNVVERGGGSGIYVHDCGRGRFCSNTVRLNSKAGFTVRTQAAVVLEGNSVCDGRASGVYVYDGGTAEMEGNKVLRNAFHGVAVRDAGVLRFVTEPRPARGGGWGSSCACAEGLVVFGSVGRIAMHRYRERCMPAALV
jgi:parallel beta-helix repeat protein